MISSWSSTPSPARRKRARQLCDEATPPSPAHERGGTDSVERQSRSADRVEAIKPRCRASEEVGLFRVTCAFCQELAGIPEHRIAVGALVDRKVALEHRARRPESLDAGLDIGTPRRRQRLRGGRLGLLVEAETAKAHAESADLDKNVLASGERLDRCRPAGKYVLPLAAIGADSDRPADMVEDDPRIRECVREVCEFVDLRMIEPGVEGKAEAAEDGKPRPEAFVRREPGPRAVGRIAHRGIRVPGDDVADAAEAVAAGAQMSRQNRFDPVPERQIRMPDNASADFGLAIDSAGAH